MTVPRSIGAADNDRWRGDSRLVTLVYLIAGTIAIIIALIGPIGYFVVSKDAYEREAKIAARLHAAFVNQAISMADGAWQTQIAGLIDADLAPSDLPEARSIRDENDVVLSSAGVPVQGLKLEQTAPLIYDASVVGMVVVERGLRPLVYRTGLVAVMAILLGCAIVGFAAALPLRSLRHTLAALRQTESQARREAESQLQIVFENAIEGIVMFEPSGNVTSFNPAARRMFGFSDDASVLGHSLGELMRPAALVPNAGGETDVVDAFPPGRIETEAMHRDGRGFPVEVAISESQENGRRARIAIVRDITERRQAEARLSYLANFDSLTNLPNRVQFRDHLANAMRRADRHGRTLELMFLDIDRFKTINDSLGHDVGDRLLQQVARALEQCLAAFGETDRSMRAMISRLGGDEFTVLLESARNQRAVESVARAILDTLSRPFQVESHELYISGSIGITRYPQKHCDLDGLVKQADVAMYHAKALGRDNFQFYSEALDAAAGERLEMETLLRHALERNEFSLQYQPKAELASGRITGVEALLRWNPTGRKPIGPDRFIPILEDTGLIVPVGAWVLRRACEQMAQWDREGVAPIHLAVNLSARQFRQQDLIETIATTLAETGFAPQRLEIELTESMLVENIEEVVRIMARIGAMGVSIAIDDFGTGHSSLSYLKRFAIDTLKVDRSFVRDTPHDADDNAITIAVIALAHGLGLRAVAEGVENDEQADFLRAQGCDEIQGYLLSRPQDPEAMSTWLRQRERQRVSREAETAALPAPV